MNAVRYLPDQTGRMDRLTQRQREANIAAEGQPVDLYADPRVADEVERYRNYQSAKAVVTYPNWYDADLVKACVAFIHEYETEVPMNPGPMPRPLCAADQQELNRRRCVEGTDPDRIRPRDYGLALALAIPVVAVGYAFIAAVMGGW